MICWRGLARPGPRAVEQAEQALGGPAPRATSRRFARRVCAGAPGPRMKLTSARLDNGPSCGLGRDVQNPRRGRIPTEGARRPIQKNPSSRSASRDRRPNSRQSEAQKTLTELAVDADRPWARQDASVEIARG
jgi:hypothetical protein